MEFARPVIAQDIGGAIKGVLRFDYFWGLETRPEIVPAGKKRRERLGDGSQGTESGRDSRAKVLKTASLTPYMHGSGRYNGTTLTPRYGQQFDLPCLFGRKIEI